MVKLMQHWERMYFYTEAIIYKFCAFLSIYLFFFELIALDEIELSSIILNNVHSY